MNFSSAWGWSIASLTGAGAAGGGGYAVGRGYGAPATPNQKKIAELEEQLKEQETKTSNQEKKIKSLEEQNGKYKLENTQKTAKINKITNQIDQVGRQIWTANQTARHPNHCWWYDGTKGKPFDKVYTFNLDDKWYQIKYTEFGCLDSSKPNVKGAYSH